MESNKKIMITVIAMFVISFGLIVCITGCKESGSPAGPAKAAAASIELCTKCGQIKASELCCKPDTPKCPKCGLAKGSPGCCKIPKEAKTATICSRCGQIKGSELCCKPDQPKCPKCGMAKGSPGCCLVPKL